MKTSIAPLEWPVASAVMALSCLAAAALFAPTVGTLVAAWSESRTYAHGFLVIPGTLYLVWCYRDRIALPAPRPWGWIAAAVPSGMWLTGRIQHNVTLEQVSVLATIPCLVYCVWGEAVFRQLLLPLGFLVFALPVGASLEPWLQEITTDFLAFSLQAADIPFHREGYFITLPSGQWEVAVDCGGLRYLLPGMALGYLYAAVVYRRPLPRILFLSLCAVLLTLANGLRAYAILVADYLGFADGTDHRVFSYLVYGVTIIVLAWVGHRWSPPAHAVSEPDAIGSRPLVRAAVMNAVAATVLLALAPLTLWMMAAGKEVVAQGTAELGHSVSDVARP